MAHLQAHIDARRSTQMTGIRRLMTAKTAERVELFTT